MFSTALYIELKTQNESVYLEVLNILDCGFYHTFSDDAYENSQRKRYTVPICYKVATRTHQPHMTMKKIHFKSKFLTAVFELELTLSLLANICPFTYFGRH